MPVLITNNHVLSEDDLENDIIIKINDEKKIISLKDRKKWTNKELDFTCIEIKEEKDNIHTFFNLDDKVLDKNYSNDCYLNQKVIIFAINMNDGQQVGFSNGVIKKNINSFFAYTCNTYPGCSGGCIVNQINNNVIGIHRASIGTSYSNPVNEGIYIYNVINSIKLSKENISKKVKKYFIIIYFSQEIFIIMIILLFCLNIIIILNIFIILVKLLIFLIFY